MSKELYEKREQTILQIANCLRRSPFTFVFQVKKKPQGIKIIYEVTQEELKDMMENVLKEE